MPQMSAYEAGLTPEEREELYARRAELPVRRSILGNPYTVRGAQAGMARQHPLAAIFLSTLLGQPKYATALATGFGSELARIVASKGDR